MSEEKNINKRPAASALLIVSFAEGACVMVAELAGGKMLAPFYGTSLYVWASTLAITLGALTIGYYLGGKFSNSENRKKILVRTVFIAAALVMVMPVWANIIMQATIDMSFLKGVVISQLAFLFLPVLCMGIVSPLIINELAQTNNSGKAAGMVYAISTLGGVLATLLTGFWLVPLIGISIPCIIAGAILLLAGILILGIRQNKTSLLLLLLIIPGIFFYKNAKEAERNSDKYEVLYHKEGMLGQMEVIALKASVRHKDESTRALLVNHNWQTWVDNDNMDLSLLFYTNFTKAFLKNLPAESNVLLIGFGGGTVARQIEKNHLNYDIVELDGRLPEIAKNYFGFQHAEKVIVDDGRHYINICKKKYDFIIIDALLGENIPSQLLSIECFEKVKNLLSDKGSLFIEFDGTPQAQKMVYNTLADAGYIVKAYSPLPNDTEADIMYLASPKAVSPLFDTIMIDSTKYYFFAGQLSKFEIKLTADSKEILTDSRPALDYLLKDKMITVRQEVLRKLNKDMLENELYFYY